MVGVPRVQPLNDYRLVFMIKKGLDTYLTNNKVRERRRWWLQQFACAAQ